MEPHRRAVLETALRAAFPDRAEILLREILRWFDDASAAKRPPEARPPDDGKRPCALCDRPGIAMLCLLRMVPATKRKKAQYYVPGLRHPLEAPPGAIDVCSACVSGYVGRAAEFGRVPTKWPHPDMVLTDARRALAAEGSEVAAGLAEEIDERSERTAPRKVGTVACDVCGKRAASVAGRARICLACLEQAHGAFTRMLEIFSRLGG